MQNKDLYRALAQKLDSFPQGFPATSSGVELDLLAYLFTPDEARFASALSLDFIPMDEAARQASFDSSEARLLIKSMSGKGLIYIQRGENGIEVSLPPFVVGFYENQVNTMDETLAKLFEDYFQEGFSHFFANPPLHRVVPVNETIKTGIEILPEESVSTLVSKKKAWAVQDCICRKQQTLIGKGCDHPLRVCLVMSDMPGVFDTQENMDALSLEGALAVLDEAAEAGLVHTVSNHKSGISYVCNCCTCSCGILRSIAEANIANVVARSAYYAEVDEILCLACGNCEEMCQFNAVSVDDVALVNYDACVGCGVCAKVCPEEAITLAMRKAEDILETPDSMGDWLVQRGSSRS